MDWKEIGKKIAGLGLPILGTAIGGPAGGAVASVVANALGCADTPEAIDQAITADPEAVVKLRTAQMEHEQVITAAYLADRQSARDREVKIVQATGEKEGNLYALAWVSVIGFYVILALVITVDLPTTEAAKTVMAMLFGAVVGNVKDVHGYFFGSSKSSKDKDKIISAK